MIKCRIPTVEVIPACAFAAFRQFCRSPLEVSPVCAWAASLVRNRANVQQGNPRVCEGGTGYTIKNDRVQDVLSVCGRHSFPEAGTLTSQTSILSIYTPALPGGGNRKPRTRAAGLRFQKWNWTRCKPRIYSFAAPGRCRHARAVYELAHNLMWLDVA